MKRMKKEKMKPMKLCCIKASALLVLLCCEHLIFESFLVKTTVYKGTELIVHVHLQLYRKFLQGKFV
jgi:hypothetical protein